MELHELEVDFSLFKENIGRSHVFCHEWWTKTRCLCMLDKWAIVGQEIGMKGPPFSPADIVILETSSKGASAPGGISTGFGMGGPILRLMGPVSHPSMATLVLVVRPGGSKLGLGPGTNLSSLFFFFSSSQSLEDTLPEEIYLLTLFLCPMGMDAVYVA